MNVLTAEQVCETVLKHGNVMGPRFYGDWQAITDELNAELSIAQNSEIDEPDTIRNKLEDNGYVVMPHLNDKKLCTLDVYKDGKLYSSTGIPKLYPSTDIQKPSRELDTRKKLEDEIRSMRKKSSVDFCHSDVWVEVPIGVVLKWLDRQAAITSAEWERATDVVKAERDELKKMLKNRTCKNIDRLANLGFFTCSECGMGGEHGIPNFCSNCGAEVLLNKK